MERGKKTHLPHELLTKSTIIFIFWPTEPREPNLSRMRGSNFLVKYCIEQQQNVSTVARAWYYITNNQARFLLTALCCLQVVSPYKPNSLESIDWSFKSKVVMFEYWVLFADQGLIVVQSVHVLTAELAVLNFSMDRTGSIPIPIQGWPMQCL